MTTYVGADWVFPGDNMPALNAPISDRLEITIDPAGNPVIVDAYNCLIERLRPDGTLSVIAGNGFCDPTLITVSGNGGPAVNAQLSLPLSATYDQEGNLCFSNQSQVRKVAPDGTITLFAGSGNPGFLGDGGPATQAQFHDVRGLSIDRDGNLYVADNWNHRVRKIDRNGVVSTVAGNGSATASGDGGPAVSAGVPYPRGLAVDAAGNLYITNLGNIVRKVAPDGTISTLPGIFAETVAVDSAGALYFGTYPSSIYKLAPGSTKAALIAGGPQKTGYSGDGGPATQAFLGLSCYPAPDRAGNVWIADSGNSRIRKVAPNGIITTVAGNGNFKYAGENTAALSTPLDLPHAVTVGPNGDVFYSEPTQARVRKATRGSDGVVRVTTVAGAGAAGAAGQIRLSAPNALVTDGAGNLYIGDVGRVLKLTPQAAISTYVEVPQGDGLAMDRSGNLYIASQNDARVRKVDPTGRVTVVAGTGVSGYSGDGGPATQAQLQWPVAVAVDSSNNLYIVDIYNGPGTFGRVRMVNPSGVITTFAGGGSPGSSAGDGGPAVKANLVAPFAIAFDAAGNLYISDAGRRAIRKVDRSGIISTVAGGGDVGQLGDGLPATRATLGNPSNLAFDATGNLYIVDGAFDRVRVVLATPPAMQVAPAEVVLPNVASGGAPVSQPIVVTGSIPGVAFDLSIQSSGSGQWLSADTRSDVAPRLITLTADPGNLAPGAYSATVTIKPAGATPEALTVNVSLSVGAGQPARLALDRQSVSFTLPQNAVRRAATVQVSNAGGQTLTFAASVATESGGQWLAVSPASGAATPGKPSSLNITANPAGLAPGTYTGTVTVAAGAAGNQTVAVVMTVSANRQAVLLTQTGLSFTAVETGGVIPPQTFGVLNAGSGVMNWTASTSTTTGAGWLQVSPASGATDAAGAAPQVVVSVNAAGLAAGKYYGTVRVDAPGTANRSRVLTVFLDVLPANSAVAASVQPPELIFYATSSTDLPGSQSFLLYNISASPRSFTSSHAGGALAFRMLPNNGGLAPDRPTRVLVQPTGPFPSGPSTSNVNFQFSDGTVQTAKVTVISSPGTATTSARNREAHDASPHASCAPSKLVVALKTLGQSFQVSAGWPVGLSVSAMDDCSNPVVAETGSVWAHFDSGEDDVQLTALGDGTWQGTWRPQKVNPRVTITVNARSGGLPTAQNVITGSQASANDRPAFTLDSITNVFATPAPKIRPLAPGSFLSIYGSRLSDFTTSSNGALPTQLANTQVYFDDRPAPINYVADGQINVVVPQAVNLNTTAQVRVQRGLTLSEPVAVDIAASHTSILQIDGNAWSLDTPASGGAPFLVGPAAPASVGDTLVLYCTGLGVTTPALADGAITPGSPLSTTPGVAATIGGKDAPVAFAGLVPGFVGLYQLNLIVPAGVTGASVPLAVSSGGQTSPAVNLAIR